MLRRVGRMVALALLVASSKPLQSQQEYAFAERGPRFLLAARPEPVRVDIAKSAVLRQRITLDLRDVSVHEALQEIARQSGLQLMYRAEVIEPRPVTLRAEAITVAAALTEVLLDANVDLLFSKNGNVALIRRSERPLVGSISGTVTEVKTGNAVSGAQVSVSGTNLGRVTDQDGRYSIGGVPAGAHTVTVRRLGYTSSSQDVVVRDGETATADIVIVAAVTRLTEIVTTVTGAQRRVELGHSIGRVNADSISSRAPVTNFGDLLQGRSPGVFSLTTSSRVGQAGMVRIRGLNSFNVPNDPIVVMDGVRIESTGATDLPSVFSSGLPTSPTAAGYTGNRLADLDPADIASIDIIKGPSAATLYGTDAANGVIVITTKRGQPGATRWTAFTEHGILSQRLEDWGATYGGAPYYSFGRTVATGAPVRCILLDRAAGRCVLDSLVSFNAQTDPATRPWKNGGHSQYGLQASGGTSGGATYFFAGDYQQETGTQYMPTSDQEYLLKRRGSAVPDWQIRPNAYEKVNVRSNLTTPLGARGIVTFAGGFASNHARQPANWFDPPFYQIGFRDANNGWYIDSRPANNFAAQGQDMVRRFTAGLSGSYASRPWLVLRGTVGADLSSNSYGMLLRKGDALPGADNTEFRTTGYRTANQLDISRYSVDFGATATRTVSEAATSKSSVGFQFNRRNQRGIQVNARNLPLGGQTVAGAADPLSASEATLATALAGAHLEEMLSLRDRLFVALAARFDGGSAFGEGFSIATYPKASVSWLVTDGRSGYALLGVGTLRLRAAVGASGVQPGPTAARQQITVTTGISGTGVVPAATVGQFGNPDLKPERTSEIEAGADVDGLGGYLRFEITAYHRMSSDALVNRPLAPDVGGTGSRWENIGTVRNRGLELTLGADFVHTDALAAGVNITASTNQNRLIKLRDGVVVSSPTSQGFRQDIGYPLQGVWGVSIQSFADANSNGIIEANEVTLTPNHYLGPGFPTKEATAAPYVRLFKERATVNALVQYRGGFFAPDGNSGNTCRFVLSCRAVNDISTPLADQARAVGWDAFVATGAVTEERSYALFRELSVALAIPEKFASRVRARDAQVMLGARNVGIIWKKGRYSPAPESESVSVDKVNFFGGSAFAGPPTYWLMRVNLGF